MREKTVVILGAASSYGTAVVEALAGEGMNLVLGGWERDRLEALEKETRERGGQALAIGADLSKRHHAIHLVEAAREGFGGVDALLFMARTPAPSLASLDVGAWERSVDANLKGFLYCLAAALPVMREQGEGCVIFVSFDETEREDPIYAACRAAVRTLLEDMRREFIAEGIRVDEVTLDGQRAAPEDAARAVLRILGEPSSSSNSL